MTYRILRHARCLTQYFKINYIKKSSGKLCSNVSTAPSSIENEGILKNKLNQLVQWYEETTGMDEVRLAQRRVLEAEEKFITAQDRRRESNKEVAIVQNKLKDLYAELDSTARGEERYVALITEEHKLLKKEKQVMEEFTRYEREEREHFSALSSAVKESHEKERAQAERTKYWSIIGSIIGTIIGIAGSSINNEIKMKELRRLIKESTINHKVVETSTGSLDIFEHQKELNALAREMNVSSRQNDDVVNQLKHLITAVDSKVKSNQNIDPDSILNAISQQQLILENNLREIRSILKPNSEIQINNEGLMNSYNQDEYTTTKMLLLSAAIVVFPVIFRYFNFFS